jgi:hypothetical protein
MRPRAKAHINISAAPTMICATVDALPSTPLTTQSPTTLSVEISTWSLATLIQSLKRAGLNTPPVMTVTLRSTAFTTHTGILNSAPVDALSHYNVFVAHT